MVEASYILHEGKEDVLDTWWLILSKTTFLYQNSQKPRAIFFTPHFLSVTKWAVLSYNFMFLLWGYKCGPGKGHSSSLPYWSKLGSVSTASPWIQVNTFLAVFHSAYIATDCSSGRRRPWRWRRNIPQKHWFLPIRLSSSGLGNQNPNVFPPFYVNLLLFFCVLQVASRLKRFDS
jgi:hypothetical protein